MEQIDNLERISSPRIKMHVNGHRFIAGFRGNHPGHPELTEYAVFEANGDYFISVASGGDPKLGRLTDGGDTDVISDAHQAVNDFHGLDQTAWDRRETITTDPA